MYVEDRRAARGKDGRATPSKEAQPSFISSPSPSCLAAERVQANGAFFNVNHVRFGVGRLEHLERLLEVVVANVVTGLSLAIAQKAAAGLVDAYAHVDETHVCTGAIGNPFRPSPRSALMASSCTIGQPVRADNAFAVVDLPANGRPKNA